jgi:ABC-type phosphate transport system substrate-binding protein
MRVNHFRLHLLAAFLLCPLVSSYAHHMAVVVNKENGVGEVTSAHLAKIFREEVTKWPDGKSVILILHKANSGELLTLQHLNHMSSTDLKGFLAAHQETITMVNSDDDVLKLVENTPGAIGLIDVRSITEGVSVVRVDGKLPMEDGYLPH